MSKEAMKLALEPLENHAPLTGKNAITALREALVEQPAKQDIPDLIAGALGVSRGTAYDLMREALAEAQQEPVAWIEHEWSGTGLKHLHFERRDPILRDEVVNPVWTPLYTSPPAQRKPLTDEQQITEALRQHGLTLVKTSNGYAVLRLGQIDAHGITGETK